MNQATKSQNTRPQQIVAVSVSLLVCCSLAACEPPRAFESQASSQAALDTEAQEPAMDSQSSQTGSVVDLDAVLKEGMPYGDLRNEVLTQGWVPVVDPQCRVKLAGEDHETLCRGNSDLAVCRACDNMPELSEYGNSGYARTWFQKGEVKLEVVANGMLEDWNVSGDDSRFNVSWWKVSKVAQQDQ